jgi:hypothetical protein
MLAGGSLALDHPDISLKMRKMVGVLRRICNLVDIQE